MAKQDLSALIGKAKETQMSTPVQRIVPIKTKIKETPKGFNTLKEYLPVWIEEKLHKIDNN